MQLLDFDIVQFQAIEFVLTQVETLNAGIGSNIKLGQPVVGKTEIIEVRVVTVLEICDPVVTELGALQGYQVRYIN